MPLMIYWAAALTSFSDSISYITYLFSEWRIAYFNCLSKLFTYFAESRFKGQRNKQLFQIELNNGVL